MTKTTQLLKNAFLINEGQQKITDLLLVGDRIAKIAENISAEAHYEVIDLKGAYLLPGIIDDQVHFREPGLTHKAHIASESRAAVAGGITSFIEQPNTVPNAVTHTILEEKYQIAANTSFANYSFMLGGTNNNLEEIKKTNPKNVAGIKLFLGSSTGNMLVDDPQTIESIFSSTPLLIAAHCEDEATVQRQTEYYKEQMGNNATAAIHPLVRNAEACYLSSSQAINLAKKTGARLHVFHLSTEQETHLFRNDIPTQEKQITAEVCVHHLWFTDADYAEKGNLIKWNPAVKTQADREGLWNALQNNLIDVIATDHAPHTWEEKNAAYWEAPSGGPLVQHALPAMLQAFEERKLPLTLLVEKMAHQPATIFKIDERGFVREGYFADLVVVSPEDWTVQKDNLLYQCGWSPFDGHTFPWKVQKTFVNGQLVYDNGVVNMQTAGKRLTFNR